LIRCNPKVVFSKMFGISAQPGINYSRSADARVDVERRRAKIICVRGRGVL
jgi:hypothetical protein